MTTPTPPHVRRNALDKFAIEHAVDQLTQAVAEIQALHVPVTVWDYVASEWVTTCQSCRRSPCPTLEILERRSLG